MSVRDLRDTFNGHSMPGDPVAKGSRCVAVRMSYCDADGKGNLKRDHQLVELDVVRAHDNTSKTIKLVVPCSSNLHVHVAAAARKELAG